MCQGAPGAQKALNIVSWTKIGHGLCKPPLRLQGPEKQSRHTRAQLTPAARKLDVSTTTDEHTCVCLSAQCLCIYGRADAVALEQTRRENSGVAIGPQMRINVRLDGLRVGLSGHLVGDGQRVGTDWNFTEKKALDRRLSCTDCCLFPRHGLGSLPLSRTPRLRSLLHCPHLSQATRAAYRAFLVNDYSA